MAKTPIMGLVKTRLGRDIGPAAATGFYRATAQAVIGRLSRDPRFDVTLAIAPDIGVASPMFDLRVRRVPQGRGDLGVRMQRQLLPRAGKGPRYRPTLVVGTDIPGITPDAIMRAFRLLGSHDVVFGPADDGGFWMVGYRSFPARPHPFAGVRWSHAETLRDVRDRLEGLRVALAGTLQDVDGRGDLQRLSPLIGRRILPVDART